MRSIAPPRVRSARRNPCRTSAFTLLPAGLLAATLAATSVGLLDPGAATAAGPRCQGLRATIVGTPGNDTLNGTNGDDVIWTGGGVDSIGGRKGDDVICAGPGDDTVHGGQGADRILGEGGIDDLNSGPGPGDVLDGGVGDDELFASGVKARLIGGDGEDRLTGDADGAVLEGGDDDDKLVARAQRVSSLGGDGHDDIDGAFARDLVVDGGPGDDHIATKGGADGAPDRPVTGGTGRDTILGGTNRDWLDGGPDDDTINPGPGDFGIARGGSGNDTLTDGGSTDVILLGDDGDDDLTAVTGRSSAEGGAGNDTLTGGDGQDDLLGGPGNDSIDARGGDDVHIEGSAGADDIHGGDGDDTLSGGDGNDLLWGETGTDVCGGGAGDDWCDGGPVGTDAPSSEDPDLCLADVEDKHNCRAEDPAWKGTAEGTLTDDGVVETWSAVYSLDEVVAGSYWAGDATIQWRVAGTDSQGCTYDGAATLDGRSDLALWSSLGYYSHEVHRNLGETASVVVDCPTKEPETVVYQPLNTDAADAQEPSLPPAPVTHLQGSATYVPVNTDDGEVVWSWDLWRGQ